MGRTGKKLAIAAGLFVVSAALHALWMLTGTTPNTTMDWVTLALLLAAGVALCINAVQVHRDDTRRAEHQGRQS